MSIIYLIYQICIVLPLFLVVTVILCTLVIIGSLCFKSNKWAYYPGMIWSRITCWLLLLPVKVVGREKLKDHVSYVFVANHQGVFDVFLIYGYLMHDFRWMMKQSLRRIPLVGKTCEKMGHVYVDRRTKAGVKHTYEQARASLRDGVSLVVFPEGARTFTGHMGYFKRGAFHLADELHLSIVPITIDGSFEVLPRTGHFIHWHRLCMTIHDPIEPDNTAEDDASQRMDKAYRAIESAMPEKYRGMVRNYDQEVIS